MNQRLEHNKIETAQKEIEYLRKEIDARSLDQSKLERNVVIGIGAIYYALATVHIANETVVAYAKYLWFVPILLSVAGTVRFFDHHWAISNIGDYIYAIEAELKPIAGGWQHYYPIAKKRHPWARWVRFSSWGILIGITIAVPFFVISAVISK